MSTVYRGSFSTLWITLQSDETLGVLDSDYLEDYFGNDGQISLYHIDTDTYFPIVMIEQPLLTPTIPFDVFRGQIALAGLPNGSFEIRGRCKDELNHYTIIGAVQTPLGGEDLVTLPLQIVDGVGPAIPSGPTGILIRVGITGPAIQRSAIEHGCIQR